MSTPTLEPTVNSAWRLDVNTGTTAVPVWTQVRAVNSFSPNVNYTTQDASDFDTGDWGSDAVTQRKWQAAAVLLRKHASGVYDPGQEALRQAADDVDLVEVRFYDRSTPAGEAYQGTALVQWAPQGGVGTALQSVNVTLLGQGARVPIGNPSGTGTVPVISSVTPTGQTVGDQIVIKGGNYTGTTAVTIDGVSATEFVVVDASTLVAVIPATVAGAADITVTTPGGTSAPYAYTAA